MANDRKKLSQPPKYNDPGWGDSISVSKKAREELAEAANNAETKEVEPVIQKKTARLKEYSSYSNPNKKTSRLVNINKQQNEDKEELTSQVDQLNNEINKAVSEIENVLVRFGNQFFAAMNNFFLSIYHLILKILLLVFIEPIKNVGKYSALFLNLVNDSLDDLNGYLSGKPKSKTPKPKAQATETAKKVTANLQNNTPQTATQAPQATNTSTKLPIEERFPDVFDGIVFGELARKGIVFLNIKNLKIYEESSKGFTVEEEQNLLETAIKEINNCARLAKSLPAPTNGKYIGVSMEEILQNVGMEDLKTFLQYVYTHPKPFRERQLRLSEAFATWAHKGAPL